MEVAIYYNVDRKRYLQIKKVEEVMHYGDLNKFRVTWTTIKGVRMEATFDSKTYYFSAREEL